MAYQPTEWKNRLVERPRTYQLQQNADGTVTQIPAEGEIFEEGTPVNAGNMNHIEQGIKDAYELAAAAETPSGAQAKVDALAGEGNTATVKAVDDALKSHLSDNTAHVNARYKVNVDFNTLDKTGFYIAEGTSLVNSPTGTASGVFYIEVIEYADGTNHLMQLAYSLYETQHVYRRQKINGTWSAWFDLFQYANDGKTGIANAVTAKGVAASPTDTFATLAGKIGQIQTGPTLSAGNILLLASTAEDYIASESFTKVKEIQCTYGGTIRVSFDMNRLDGTAHGRVYVNGVAKGVDHYTSSVGYVTYTDDITINPGDLVQLYTYNTQAGNGCVTWFKNFNIYVSNTPFGKVNL